MALKTRTTPSRQPVAIVLPPGEESQPCTHEGCRGSMSMSRPLANSKPLARGRCLQTAAACRHVTEPPGPRCPRAWETFARRRLRACRDGLREWLQFAGLCGGIHRNQTEPLAAAFIGQQAAVGREGRCKQRLCVLPWALGGGSSEATVGDACSHGVAVATAGNAIEVGAGRRCNRRCEEHTVFAEQPRQQPAASGGQLTRPVRHPSSPRI